MAYTPYSLNPFVYATVQAVPHRDGWLQQPPLVLPVVALEWNNDPDSDTENARLDHMSGEFQGEPILLPRDTYLNGASGSFTGRAFTAGGAGSGQWKMFRDEDMDTWGILRPQNDLSTEFSLTADNVTAGIEHIAFCVRRWLPVDATLSAANWYTRLHLNYGLLPDFRILFAYGKAVGLQATTDGVTWKTYQMARNLGNAEQIVRENNNLYRVRVQPDYARNTLTVEVGSGQYMHFTPRFDLPASGRLALVGASGSVNFQVFTVRYGSPTVTVNQMQVPSDYGIDHAFYRANALRGAVSIDAEDSIVTDVLNNGDGTVKVTATATDADAGEGIGAEEPPTLSDGLLVLPAVWTEGIPGGENPTDTLRLRSMLKHETQIWDDVRRNAYTYGEIICNNVFSDYTGGYVRRALDIWDSVDGGTTLYKRLTGVCGIGPGLTLSWMGSDRMRVPFSDNSVKLRQPLGSELILDGWELGCAHRYLLERGTVDWTRFGNTYLPPLYIPPGAPFYAPYGPAGEDAPADAIILGRGTGAQQRYRFDASMLLDDVQQVLVQDHSDFAGRPFYTAVDKDGQHHVEAWEPGRYPVAAGYATDPYNSTLNTLLPSGAPLLKIHSSIEVTNSTESMRSELTFQGLNAVSFHLMTAHVEMPAWVQEALGWRQPWFERSGRWGTEEYLAYLLTIAAYKASLMGQTVVFTATYHPAIHAGMRIAVDDRKTLGGVGGIYVILRQDSIVGEGDLSGQGTRGVADAVLVARRQENL